MACPCCGGASDVFGDHLTSCKKNNPVGRHNALRNALANILRSNGLSCQLEVAIGGKQRPADVALFNLDTRGPLAVDIVVHQPLSLSNARDPSTVKRALAEEENDKVKKEATLRTSNGWLFAPMAWHPWGGIGPQGTALVRRMEKVIGGDAQGWKRTMKLSHFRQALSFALMSQVGHQLVQMREAEPSCALPAWCATAPLPMDTTTFEREEEQGWDEPMEDGERRGDYDEPFFVGPIRVTTPHSK